MSREYLNALWELTKRELRRKYARSYLGILWSVFYPLLRMALVVFMFTQIFNKGIDNYPVYYFVAYLLFEFWDVSVLTSVTTLRDNSNLLIKSRLPYEIFVLSRVFTAFINMMLGFIPFLGLLIIYRIPLSWTILLFPVDLIFLWLFVSGLSYLVSSLYVSFRDIKDISSKVIMILRYFVAMFYSIDWVSNGVRNFIEHNPPYVFIKIARDSLLYGRVSELKFWIQMVIFGLFFYLFGKIFFELNKDNVVERL